MEELVMLALDKHVTGSHHFIHRMLEVLATAYRTIAFAVPDAWGGGLVMPGGAGAPAKLAALRRQLDRVRPPWHRTNWPAGSSDRSVVLATAGQAYADAVAAAECALVSAAAHLNDCAVSACTVMPCSSAQRQLKCAAAGAE
jgi:hypothetical protein